MNWEAISRIGQIVGAIAAVISLTNRCSTVTYEVRPRKDHRGVDLISDVLPFGRLLYGGPNAMGNAISYAKFFSRSDDAVIRVYHDLGNLIEMHEHKGDFKEW